MTARSARALFAEIALSGRGRAIRLYHEDGVQGLVHRLRAGSVDVVVTSPPYNLGQAYSQYRDRRPRAEYLAWIRSLAESVDRVLAPRGSFFLNFGATPRDPWLAWDVAREVRERFELQNVLHWVKSIAIDRRLAGRAARLDRDLALGHYRPVRSDRFVHGAHEYVFQFTRSGSVPIDRLALGVAYQDPSNVRRWGTGGGARRCRGNTWFLPYATIQQRSRDRPHPASFPPELAEWCVRLHGRARVRRWADPFVGIGSSAVAAVRIGRSFAGFDIDRRYLAVARRRVRAALSSSVPDRSRPAEGSTRGSGAS
ncbi:MAG: DNA-methyltransferase [Thermoplasmata archaeon]